MWAADGWECVWHPTPGRGGRDRSLAVYLRFRTPGARGLCIVAAEAAGLEGGAWCSPAVWQRWSSPALCFDGGQDEIGEDGVVGHNARGDVLRRVQLHRGGLLAC